MEKNRIYIKNIYYMLSYVYTDLIQQDYKDIDIEDFDNIGDVLSVILFKTVTKQIKRGFIKGYNQKKEELSVLTGKINIQKSIKLKANNKNQLYCEFDDLSINNYLNSIIKTAIYILVLSKDISKKNKNNLKKLIHLFNDIDLLEPKKINWKKIKYNKINKNYIGIINICYLILNDFIMKTKDGLYKMPIFLSEKQIYNIYEKFVLAYYKKHYPDLHPNASKIKWNLDNEKCEFLPEMKSDITLTHKENILIIDTKYYSNTMQTIELYNSKTIHSNNLYQIFTYVKNKDINKIGKVSGMLLYAKTNEDIVLDKEYMMSGNKIMVKTLDLNREFKFIAEGLNKIALDLINS